MQFLLDKITHTQAYHDLLADTRGKDFVAAFGVQPNEKPLLAAIASTEHTVLYVCSDYVESQRIFRAMASLCAGDAVYLPHREDVLLYKRGFSKNVVYNRNAALYRMSHGVSVVVTCIDALMQWYPPCDKFVADAFDVVKGVCYDGKLLRRNLVACGYKRVDAIEGEGEFTVRGDILEVSMPFGKRYRVDFWDDEVEKIVKAISDRAPEIKIEYEAKIRERISEVLESVTFDETRLLQEVALFADKSNIDEELTRLKSHIAQLRRICEEETDAGKKLDFLMQEFNREANTVCSKSNDIEITKYGLALKNEIEKIREQVQNIE